MIRRVVSYLIERVSGLAKRTLEPTKITKDFAQKTIGSTTLYSQRNIAFNKRYDPTRLDGHDGVQNKSKMSLAFCIIIEPIFAVVQDTNMAANDVRCKPRI